MGGLRNNRRAPKGNIRDRLGCGSLDSGCMDGLRFLRNIRRGTGSVGDGLRCSSLDSGRHMDGLRNIRRARGSVGDGLRCASGSLDSGWRMDGLRNIIRGRVGDGMRCGSLSWSDCSGAELTDMLSKICHLFRSPLGSSSCDWIHNPTINTCYVLFAPLDNCSSAAREARYLSRNERNEYNKIS
jgi:hypothetical protein